MKNINQLKKENIKTKDEIRNCDKHIDKAMNYLIKKDLDNLIRLDFANKDNVLTDGITDVIKEGISNKDKYLTLKGEFTDTLFNMGRPAARDFIYDYYKEDIKGFYSIDKTKFFNDVAFCHALTKDDIETIKWSNTRLNNNDFLQGDIDTSYFLDMYCNLAKPYILKILKHADYKIYHPRKFLGLKDKNELRLSLSRIDKSLVNTKS